MPLSTRLQHVNLPAGLGMYAVSGLATLWVARSLAGGSHELLRPIVAIAVGALIPVALHWAWRSGAGGWSRVFEGVAWLLMAVAVVRLWTGTLEPFPYGDGGSMSEFIRTGHVFPIWLAGMALANWLYLGVWQFAPIAVMLPAAVASPISFVGILCALSMGSASIALLRRWPDRLAVVLPMLLPVWVLFSVGYAEYYPLMIGAWLAALIWLFDRPIAERPAWAIGALIGALPTLYVGFAPVSVLLVVLAVVTRPADVLKILGAALAAFAVIVTVCFPGGMQAFIPAFFGNLGFGESGVMFPRYRGHMAGATSVAFAAQYALSVEHLKDLLFMVFWGGGWPLPFLVAGAAVAAKRHAGWPAGLRDSRVWLGAALIVWNIYYLVFIPPKMGPAKDVDFFCPVYVTAAFIAGRLLDAIGFSKRPGAYQLLCGLAGATVAVSSLVAWVWLLRRP